MRILIVDDSRFTRALLRREFEKDSEVDEAGDGLEALRHLECHPAPDLILVDLLMPRMNGFELVQALRQRGYDGPIVVCTANTQPSVERRVREIGATEFVPKPELLVPGHARALVQSLLAGRHQTTKRHRIVPIVETQDIIGTAMESVAGILNGLTNLPVECYTGAEHGAGTGEERPLATIRISVSLAGGIQGTASLTLPGTLILQAAFERMGPTTPPRPSAKDVALEIGNILLNAFVARLNDGLSQEVHFADLRFLQGPEIGEAVDTDENVRDAVEVRGEFSVEGVDEVGTLSLVIDSAALESIVGAGGVAPA